MKTSLVIALITFMLLIAGRPICAQTCISSSSTNVPIDTVTTTVDLQGPMDPIQQKKRTGQIVFEVIFWNTSSGPAISVAPPIHFTGDPMVLDSLPLVTLFDMMARVAVAQGVGNGIISCPQSGSNTVTYYQPSCVARMNVGTAIELVSCDLTACCVRTFSVTCPNGTSAPQITDLTTISGSCTSNPPPATPCLPTCP